MNEDYTNTEVRKPFKYIITLTKAESGMFRAVLVDEQSNPAQHTALESEGLIGLLHSVKENILTREDGKPD